MRLQAVVFDIDGTLIFGRRGAFESAMEGLRAAHSVLASAGVPLPDFRTTFALMQREMTRNAASMTFGNFRESSMPDLVRDFVSKAFPGTPERVVDEALEAWYSLCAPSVAATPGAYSALAALKGRGILVAAAGNSAWGSKYVRKDLERAGLLMHIDSVTCSADVGFRKPNLFLLTRALQSLGAEADAAIHVGDDPHEDVEAPQEAGMTAVLIGRPELPSRADAVISGLDCLMNLVDRLVSDSE